MSKTAARDHGIGQIHLLTKSLAAAGVALSVVLSVVVAKVRPGVTPAQVSTSTQQDPAASTAGSGQGGLSNQPSITDDPNAQSNGGLLPPPVPLRRGHRGGSAVSGAS